MPKKKFETGLVYDQPQLPILVCPPMNPELVSYTGRIDAGAAHRAIAAARALVIAGVWNGKDPIAIHNPYELENKLLRLEWDGKTAAELVAGVDYDIYSKPSFETDLIYDQPQPAPINPHTHPEAFETKLVYTEDGTPYLTLVRKPEPIEFPAFNMDEWVLQIARGDFAEAAQRLFGAAPIIPMSLDIFEETANSTTGDISTDILYDQPQPFSFERGDIVEFKMAFPSHKLLEGVWLRGTFYNVYPGDPRYACIRNCGLPEAARLADIRYPEVKDIFDGMGDFNVKPLDSAKAA